MSCLDATFTLTPRSPYYYNSWNNQAWLYLLRRRSHPSQPIELIV